MSALRERVWQLCGLSYQTIHINIDTTVETVYGSQQGGRKGHNPKNRGKKGTSARCCVLSRRPANILWGSFEEARPSGGGSRRPDPDLQEVPSGVRKEGDSSWGWRIHQLEAVKAPGRRGFTSSSATRDAPPPFDPAGCYKARKNDPAE